ncbi:MAG TPA: helix-turn-helix domain-containing protein [Steroidobacteraceae bacterium]|nr:helix-turn-helix domain-containing protein [Steroidobacteraceae bacterium]
MKCDRRPKKRARPHRVVMLGFEGAQVLDITGPLEVFARTARWLAEHRGATSPAYLTELVAERRGPLRMSSGLELVAARRFAEVNDADTLLVAGGIGWESAARDRALLDWLSRQAGRVQRLGSICNGAMILAAAGLLDGKPATTHWAYLDRLATVAPQARVDRDALYVRAGNIYTSAGVTAGMDLALALVEQDHGKAVALAVAQELVLFLKRPGGQSQFSRHLAAQKRDDLFGELELWMLDNPRADLSVDSLARRMSMSPRHFARLFRARLGTSPGSYVRRLRVEQARRRIEEGASRLKQVARDCGFPDEQSLRRNFQDLVGITPAEYRARF